MELTKQSKLLEDLKQAVERLKEAVVLEPTRINQDGTIQRFEFTFELSWKLMRTVLLVQGIDCFSPRDCIRKVAQAGLIDDPEKWFEFLKARSLTTHVYDQKMADKIYEKAKEFPKVVEELMEKVEVELKEDNIGER